MEQCVHAVFLQQRQKFFIKLQCNIGVLGGIFLDQAHRHVAHGFLHSSFADQILDGDSEVVKVDLREIVHVVALLGFEEVMCQHGVEHFALHADAVLHQHGDVVFQVLPDFEDAFVLKQGSQQFQFLLTFFLFGRHGKIPSFVRLDGEGEAHQFRRIHVNVGGFGVEDELFFLRQ